jgi:hypothetical protein
MTLISSGFILFKGSFFTLTSKLLDIGFPSFLVFKIGITSQKNLPSSNLENSENKNSFFDVCLV